MNVTQLVNQEINRLAADLQVKQAQDGAWRFCLESGPMSAAYMIILLQSVGEKDKELISKLVEQLLHLQENNGTWKLFPDEDEGNLSATVEAYFALLYSQLISKNEDRMQKARKFILSRGGITEVKLLTKVMLSLTGQYPWHNHFLVPLEMVLLPPTSLISMFNFSSNARVHMVPALIVSNLTFTIRTDETPDLSDLYLNPVRNNLQTNNDVKQYRSLLDKINEALKKLPNLPDQIHHAALQHAEQFMLNRIEPNGTLYSYMSSTFLMVFALLALGYDNKHPVITKAIQGLKTFLCPSQEHYHLQMFNSTVWDTALINHALQETGLPISHPMLQKSAQYLLNRQQDRYGDWHFHNPHAQPGGWGFSDTNTIHPDIDDTTAALRAIHRFAKKNEIYLQAWNRGLNWLLTMQNEDGGWASFEKNTDNKLYTFLPIENAKDIIIDSSTADLTGRTLEFLGNTAGLSVKIPLVQRATRWLMSNQEVNGSWYGRWGISYIYGSWAAVTGMIAVGVSPDHLAIKKATQWMLSIQNVDGGFGESCYSDQRGTYIPLRSSTPVQTAWAIDLLLAVYKKPTPEIIRGISYLLQSTHAAYWTTNYPTGAGLPGSFYLYYSSYKYIWPLLTLSHFKTIASRA